LAVAPAFAQDDLPREETLVLSIGNPVEDPTNLNIYAPGVSRSGTGLHQMIYEYFFYVNLSTNEFIPWLATDFSYNDDAKGNNVTLTEHVCAFLCYMNFIAVTKGQHHNPAGQLTRPATRYHGAS
jgi:ABC-type transport system substrate-binding protein